MNILSRLLLRRHPNWSLPSMPVNEGPYEPCFTPLDRSVQQWAVAPPEAWLDAPDSEPRFRVVRIPHAEDQPMKEYIVPKRSVASVLEDFTRGDVYTVTVERV